MCEALNGHLKHVTCHSIASRFRYFPGRLPSCCNPAAGSKSPGATRIWPAHGNRRGTVYVVPARRLCVFRFCGYQLLTCPSQVSVADYTSESFCRRRVRGWPRAAYGQWNDQRWERSYFDGFHRNASLIALRGGTISHSPSLLEVKLNICRYWVYSKQIPFIQPGVHAALCDIGCQHDTS